MSPKTMIGLERTFAQGMCSRYVVGGSCPEQPERSPRKIMRLRAISHSVLSPRLSPRKRISLVIAVAASALLGGTLAAVAATGSQAAGATQANARSAQGSAPYIFIHDPTMAREGGTYYVFSTGDPA